MKYRSYNTFADLLEAIERGPHELIEYLKRDRELLRLLERNEAIEQRCALPPNSRRKFFQTLNNLQKTVRHLIWPDSSRLYGRCYVTENLKKQSTAVATLVGASSAVNIISLFPLIRMAFGGLGSVGTGLSLTLTALLLATSNACGTVAATNQPKHRAWSIVGSVTFVFLNITLTVVAGPGIEVLNSQPTLRELKATEALASIFNARQESYESRLTSLRQQAETKKEECGELNDKITALDEYHPDRDRLIIQAQGSYGNRNLDRSEVPVEDLPVCEQATVLATQTVEYERETTQKLDELKGKLAKSPLLFLKQYHREIYENHFDAEGRFRDRNEAVRLATIRFNENLTSGRWSSLGFSLAFFLISLVTSGAAVVVAIVYARSQSALQSWNPVLARMREDILMAADRGLARTARMGTEIDPGSNRLSLPGTAIANDSGDSRQISHERDFLWRCADSIRESGRLTFPPFIRFVESNPDGERLLPHPVPIEDESGEIWLWSDRPDVAISYLRARTTIACGRIATLSRSLQNPEAYGNFSLKRTTQALSMEIQQLQALATNIERSFSFTSLGRSMSLLDDLQHAQEYIRHHLDDALDSESIETSRLEAFDKKQLKTYLVQIEHLSLHVSTCLIAQLEAG
ncbi:hypothetical protein IQ235_04700, partial [Oscillatoriales cyanobacterium LEGE 11467]